MKPMQCREAHCDASKVDQARCVLSMQRQYHMEQHRLQADQRRGMFVGYDTTLGLDSREEHFVLLGQRCNIARLADCTSYRT